MAKNGFSMSNRVAVEQLIADKTLTVDDCGKVFIVNSGPNGAALDITMPANPAALDGWNVEFIIESGSKHSVNQVINWTGSTDSFSEAGPNPFRVISYGAEAATSITPTEAVTGDCKNVALAAAVQNDGDRVSFMNASGSRDGWKWYVEGFTSGSLTVT